MSSAGAQCDHIAHVSTQMPYALTAAAISFVTYMIAGFIQNAAVSLIIGVVLTFLVMIMLHYLFYGNKAKQAEEPASVASEK
jgi:Na+/H+ antiporter NhaC